MQTYFLQTNTGQSGPFNLEQLKSLSVSHDTPVWREGMVDWQEAGQMDELRSLFTVPPPFVSKNSGPSKNSTNSVLANESIQVQANRKRKRLIIAGVIIISILVGAIAINHLEASQKEQQMEYVINAEEERKVDIRNHIRKYVVAERSEYQYRAIGGIYNLSISVTNNTDYPIDRVQVKITYIKANGGVWDTRLVDFHLLSPNSKSSMRIPDTNRGTSVEYEIVSVKSSALGLNTSN